MQLLFASFCARQEVASGGVRVDMNKTKQTTGILIGERTERNGKEPTLYKSYQERWRLQEAGYR